MLPPWTARALPCDLLGSESDCLQPYIVISLTRWMKRIYKRGTFTPQYYNAIDETAPVNGLQIHRSHWVALEAVSAVRRENGKVFVETTAGDRLPVSRSCLDDLRQAGLLPR